MKIFKDAFRATSFISVALITLIAFKVSTAATTPNGVFYSGQRISAGYSSTCAILQSGQVRCWGLNAGAGDVVETDRAIPTGVLDLGEQAVSVAAGYFHSCAITLSGGMKCWGRNSSGQLGNGTTTDSLTPVDVDGLSSGVIAISVGLVHTCAATASSLKCWGSNSSGQLGIGSTGGNRTIPEDVLFLGTALELATGFGHTCALTAAHSVWCWGRGSRGQLGDGGTSTPFPITVDSLQSGVSHISASKDHTCALLFANGTLKCWGANEYGQLGDGSTTDRFEPVDVFSVTSGATAIAAGYYHSCAVIDGAAKCWGFNRTGRLGDGSRANSLVPVDVIGLPTDAQLVAAGGTQSCTWHGGDAFACWGNNLRGQVGNGKKAYERFPQDVLGLDTGVSSAKVGDGHACAIRNGAVLCWGDNLMGQLGDGTHLTRNLPAPVNGLDSNMASLTIDRNHNCALTQSGVAKCWGENDYGQLGDGTLLERSSPVDVLGIGSGTLQVQTSLVHSCVLTATLGVKCWGDNQSGELGDGSTETRLIPVDVSGLTSGVQSISIGERHSCALMATGSVKCWGTIRNSFGDEVVHLVPADVSEFGTDVSSIYLSGFECLLNGAGALKCRGDNFWGELGNGTTDSNFTFVDVLGLGSSVMNVSTGSEHACAIDGQGAALCWGVNERGQLGDGTQRFSQLAPVGVVGLDSGMASIAAGAEGTCAVTTSGSVKCWGQNLYGQLGNGTNGSVLAPEQVLVNEEVLRNGFD